MDLFLSAVTDPAAGAGWSNARIMGWVTIGVLALLPFVGLLLWRKPAAVDAHNPGFLRKYVFSTDHKMVGIQFLFTGLFLFLIGGLLALAVRWQLAWPFDSKKPVPLISQWLGWPEVAQTNKDASGSVSEYLVARVLEVGKPLPADAGEPDIIGFPRLVTVETFTLGDKPMVYRLTKSTEGVLPDSVTGAQVAVWYGKGRVMPDDFYLTLMTMHASVMIFLVIIPMLVGVFGNFAVPLMIGARDMAFPRLNMFTYWLMPLGAYVMLLGFLAAGEEAGGKAWAGNGWTSYPPLSIISDAAPGSGVGQTTWGISVLILGVSSVLGAINYITTIVKLRAPGMDIWRMPLTVWSVLITSILSLLATPVLTANLILLVCDKVFGTSFFIPDNVVVSGKAVSGPAAEGAAHTGGGQVLLFQHLFWFYSHPAVYLMILPAMGVVSDVLATFARKALFGYKAMVVAIGAIALLGFVVWGHHMFQSGMNPLLGTTFMVSTFAIALPSSIKTFNWLATLWGGQIRFTAAMLNALAFVSMFIIGGLSGIYLAATALNAQHHGTYFVVAHIHYVLFGGSTFAIFAGIYYWYPKMFGRLMNERWGHIHFWLTFLSFNGVFFTMHIMGAGGMPRRFADPYQYQYLSHWHWMNKLMTMSAFTLGVAQIPFAINFLGSLFWGKKADDNPWKSNTLEWQTPSPPGHGNFEHQPTVHRGPYEYGSPESSDDWIAQNSPAVHPHAAKPA